MMQRHKPVQDDTRWGSPQVLLGRLSAQTNSFHFRQHLDNTKLTGTTLINPAHLYLGQEQTRPFSLRRFHSNPHTDASEAACAAVGPPRIFTSKPHSWPVLQHILHDTFSNSSNISPDVVHNEKSKTAIREGRYLKELRGLWHTFISLERSKKTARFYTNLVNMINRVHCFGEGDGEGRRVLYITQQRSEWVGRYFSGCLWNCYASFFFKKLWKGDPTFSFLTQRP